MRTRYLVVAVLVVCVCAPAVANAQGARASIDKRTRSMAYLVRKCGSGVTLALSLANGGSDVQVSEGVNTVKNACKFYEQQLLNISTSGGLSTASDDAFGAIDYDIRGLGRVSDYIDNGKASDIVTAKQYFAYARGYAVRAIRELNAVRSRNGLARI